VLERGLELYRVAEVPATYPWIAAGLGHVPVLKGAVERGTELLRDALEPEVRRRGPTYTHTHIRLAEAMRHLGRTGKALAAARSGRETAKAQGERGHLAWAERVLGDILAATRPADAASHYGTAIEVAGTLGMQPELELAGAGLGRLEGGSGASQYRRGRARSSTAPGAARR